MTTTHPLEEFAPLFQADTYVPEEERLIAPFFTNLNQSVYAPLIMAPELIGALCSRTSRAAGDLRPIFLHEYIEPFVNPTREPKDTDEVWEDKRKYGETITEFIRFLHTHPILDIFSNPRARSFYTKWLAQFGDDSIAQMAGSHLVYQGISQVAIKHFEDQRIGLAPIEKSTRYVNYAGKVNGRYLYYTDPTLADLGLRDTYDTAMNGLFDAYTVLLPKMQAYFTARFPQEKPGVIEKKAFDTLRGLLPCATLSQVAFFGNGQAFEHMMNRSLRHPLGEIRWAAEAGYRELNKVTPAFLRRIKEETKQELMQGYQEYLAKKGHRVAPFLAELAPDAPHKPEISVRLLEWDPDGETNVLTGTLYTAPRNHHPWDALKKEVERMDTEARKKILNAYLHGRTQRWQKVGRAFENAYVRFEIMTNIGAWRDLHRHRMQTQQRQYFSCHHGYDLPRDVEEAGFGQNFRNAIHRAEDVFAKIEQRDPDLAQYATTLAHRLRFTQYKNLRQCFWDMELRTVPEGHPDYRHIMQEQYRLLRHVYPLISERMLVNRDEYDFARRGQEEKIAQKIADLSSA